MTRRLVVGIDASNLRSGGAVTHLSQLLQAAEPEAHRIGRVVVWGGELMLPKLPERPWLKKVHVPALDRGLPWRMAWQQFRLPTALVAEGVDGLFSPGGLLPPRLPVPAVVMSQNMLPFEPAESARFARDWALRLKFALLRRGQIRDFQRAAGAIFLTRYAERMVTAALPKPPARSAVIPHGLEPRFFLPLRPPVESFSEARPFRVLYVSVIDVYKHQWHVAEAVAMLRREGLPVTVEFVGPAYPPALARLEGAIATHDPEGRFLHYRGKMPFEALHEAYREADAFVFASSCENLPNILLEAMAAGLPIASAERGPMPEVLGDAGRYFDPERPETIAEALRQLMADGEARRALAEAAQARARGYSWTRCAEETFGFLADCLR